MRGWKDRFAVVLALGGAALFTAAPAAADSLLYRCGANICRVAPDGTGRQQLTTDGRPGGPEYSWLSASRDGSRIAVSRGASAYVLDGSGRPLGGVLRAVVARDVVDTAWLGGRLLRSDVSSQPPFARGLCLLASNTDFRCERDVARDPANDLSAPAVSPDNRFVAVARSPADQNAGTGPIVLYEVAGGHPVRALTNGSDDALQTFSPDGRRLAFNRGSDIYVTAADGTPGSERRVITAACSRSWSAAPALPAEEGSPSAPQFTGARSRSGRAHPPPAVSRSPSSGGATALRVGPFPPAGAAS